MVYHAMPCKQACVQKGRDPLVPFDIDKRQLYGRCPRAFILIIFQITKMQKRGTTQNIVPLSLFAVMPCASKCSHEPRTKCAPERTDFEQKSSFSDREAYRRTSEGTKPKTPRGGVFVRGVTEIRKNEASAMPSAHFDYISGSVRTEIEKEIS